MSERIAITALGGQGDGVADAPGGPVYVPFALPGESVTIERHDDRVTLISVDQPSPDRVAPACRHFTVCGGCSLQHLAEKPYRAWKRDKVIHALAARAIHHPVSEIVAGHPGARRRVVLSARRTRTGIVLGYNRAGSNEIIDIVECPVATPEIQAAIPRIWSLAALLASTRDAFHVTVTQTMSGLDIAVSGAGALTEETRKAAVEMTIREKFARVSCDGEVVVEPGKPLVRFGTALVPLPPGGFLQAVAVAEGAMAEMAADHLRKARRVADLFAGSGAFTLRLAAMAEVHAVESDAAALAALDRGFRSGRGLRRVTNERRDLFRRPMTARELAAFDGVVFDPPRAGAEEQSVQLARSDVPLVAAISCNPATLARDLRILIDGGYALRRITPVDQFLWSPHVEVVALLEKPRRRR